MIELNHKCLWPTLVTDIPTFPKLTESTKVDVCVIGGGFTGLSAALHLAERGKRVCVLEAQKIAYGGSGRNVGLVNAGVWVKPDDVVKALGEQQGERFNQAFGEAPSVVFDVINRHGIQAQHTQTGTLHMAHNAKGTADIKARHQQWLKRGAKLELLEGASAYEYCGTDKIPSALLDHRAGTVNPFAYVKGLAETVVKFGGKIYEQSKVISIEKQSDQSWAVVTDSATVLADKVVIASNAYTDGQWTDANKAMYAGYYYQVASEPLSGPAADSILPYKQGSWDTRTVLSSIRRDVAGRLILGSLGRTDNKPEWYIKKWANRIQQFYYPQLGQSVQWEYVWCGRIGFTDNHMPKLIEPEKGLVAAVGFNGRGVTTGTMMGKLFAQYLCEDDASVLPLPFDDINTCKTRFAGAKSLFLESSFSMYHLGQCLNLVR